MSLRPGSAAATNGTHSSCLACSYVFSKLHWIFLLILSWLKLLTEPFLEHLNNSLYHILVFFYSVSPSYNCAFVVDCYQRKGYVICPSQQLSSALISGLHNLDIKNYHRLLNVARKFRGYGLEAILIKSNLHILLCWIWPMTTECGETAEKLVSISVCYTRGHSGTTNDWV